MITSHGMIFTFLVNVINVHLVHLSMWHVMELKFALPNMSLIRASFLSYVVKNRVDSETVI